jgi:hypothetical protein
MEGTFSGPALVIASGPSASLASGRFVEWFSFCGGSVFGLNGFANLPAFEVRDPDILVLADPMYFPTHDSPDLVPTEALRRDIERTSRFLGRLFVPFEKLSGSPDSSADVVPFDFRGLEGWSKSIRPTAPRGYSGLTSYAALAIALYLGHSPVFLLGFDNSFAHRLEVGADNRVRVVHQHAYSEEDRDWTPLTTMDNILANVALCLYDLRLFGGNDVVNLGGQFSLVDTFPRASPWTPSQPVTWVPTHRARS